MGLVAVRPKPTAATPQGICLDKGYYFDGVRAIVREFGFTAHIRARGEEAKAFKQETGFKARRWVVERTHSWMNRHCAVKHFLSRKSLTSSRSY